MRGSVLFLLQDCWPMHLQYTYTHTHQAGLMNPNPCPAAECVSSAAKCIEWVGEWAALNRAQTLFRNPPLYSHVTALISWSGEPLASCMETMRGEEDMGASGYVTAWCYPPLQRVNTKHWVLFEATTAVLRHTHKHVQIQLWRTTAHPSGGSKSVQSVHSELGAQLSAALCWLYL